MINTIDYGGLVSVHPGVGVEPWTAMIGHMGVR